MDENFSVELGKGMGPLHLGASRDEVLQSLARAGLEYETDDEEPQWLYVDELDAELTFTEGHSPVLREISVLDDSVTLGPAAVIDQPLHTVIEFLQVPDRETFWHMEAAESTADAFHRTEPQPSPTDEELLDHGTLWVPALGLGLVMMLGKVGAVRLRLPKDVPKSAVGSLTPAQRELSQQPDLASHLLRPSDVPAGRRWFQRLLTLALVVGLGLLFWQATKYQQRWNTAPVVEAEVIAMQPPPPEPFPMEFTVAYHDGDGRRHEVVLERADVYIIQNIGDKVDLRYLPEAPDKPLGPARVNDAAFLKFMPWAIVLFGTYVVAQLAGVVVATVWSKL